MENIIYENEHAIAKAYMVEMPDGVKLFTAVAVPKGVEKAPAVLMRDPYNFASPEECVAQAANSIFAKNGYTMVRQHVRGKGRSEGFCRPYDERGDGLATHEFIRSLPSYNGEIFLVGQSYLSSVHLACVGFEGDDIKGAALHIQTDNIHSRLYHHGCCDSLGGPNWWLDMIKREYPNQDREKLYTRPYKDLIKRAIGVDDPRYTEQLLHTDENDEFWCSDERYNAANKMNFPVLLTEGWYDMYIEGMFDMWKRLPDSTREKSAMLVCPWGHREVPRTDTGFEMKEGYLPDDWVARWFDSIRTGEPYPYAELGKVRYYSVGGDHWTTALPSGEVQRLYLGNGKLSPDKTEEKAITYRYDPADYDEARQAIDFYRYHDIHKAASPEETPDTITFLSDPVTEERSYSGKIRWHMDVSSDCEDTSFYIHFYLTRGGESWNLTETITSLSYINPDYKPGERLTIDIETNPIAFTLRPGDGIRVDIASSGGTYMPHANFREHFALVEKTRVANNTIFTGGYIELPLRG